jgi:1,4-dihydroxy-2-naphthoate octaprenyltransferase
MLFIILKAARLRTLPLAMSAIGTGITLSNFYSISKPIIAILSIATAILLQILSNFANDYGDFVKGTDTAAGRTDRILASGKMQAKQMLYLILITACLSLISGLSLLYIVFRANWSLAFVGMLVLGLVAIGAAITYTVGKHAYGYKALGDLVVFIFFGPVAVLGTFFLHYMAGSDAFLPQLNPLLLINAACFTGIASTIVLTINNIRDRNKDKLANKNTIPCLLGFKKSKYYLLLLLLFFYLTFYLTLIGLNKGTYQQLAILLVSLFLFILSIYRVYTLNEATQTAQFNLYLKSFSLITLFYAVLLWL